MIDLSVWNLTIPEQVPARTIETRLVKAGYNSKYFYPNGSTITFWAPVTGTTTKNSSYPRSELRETFSNGKARNWLYREGTHRLQARLAVAQVPSTGDVVIGQLHSKDNPTPYVKLVYSMERGVGYLGVALRRRPQDKASPIVMTYKSMPLGRFFDYSIEVAKDGRLHIKLAGMEYVDQVDPAWAAKRFYFKAGMYVLDNKGPASEGGMAVFDQLSVSHTP